MNTATRLLATALTGALLTPLPALAQDHSDHDMSAMGAMSGMDMSEDGKTTPQTAPQTDAPAGSGDHADHSMHGMHANHPAPSGTPAMPMMQMSAAKDPPQGPPPPEALSGPAHAADRYYPDGAMAHSRAMVTHEMGGMHTTVVMLDRLEATLGKGGDGWAWEGALRTGGDTDRLWIKSEGEASFKEGIDSAEVQALWGHAIGPWFDLQAGVRQQLGPDPDRTQASIGVEGLAPYMFDISAEAFLSTQGEVTARIEADTDQRLTQRLILQPRAELGISAQKIAERRTGSGFTSLEAGVRLRYEIRREFAPYVGVEWQKKFGSTADMVRASGEDPDRLVALLGLRAWF